MPNFGQVPSSATVVKNAYGSAPAGRPAKVSSKYALLPVNTEPAGWMMSNTQPDVLKVVQSMYLKDKSAGMLPPGLQPTRSTALQHRTNQAISRGWQPSIGKR